MSENSNVVLYSSVLCQSAVIVIKPCQSPINQHIDHRNFGLLPEPLKSSLQVDIAYSECAILVITNC